MRRGGGGRHHQAAGRAGARGLGDHAGGCMCVRAGGVCMQWGAVAVAADTTKPLDELGPADWEIMQVVARGRGCKEGLVG